MHWTTFPTPQRAAQAVETYMCMCICSPRRWHREQNHTSGASAGDAASILSSALWIAASAFSLAGTSFDDKKEKRTPAAVWSVPYIHRSCAYTFRPEDSKYTEQPLWFLARELTISFTVSRSPFFACVCAIMQLVRHNIRTPAMCHQTSLKSKQKNLSGWLGILFTVTVVNLHFGWKLIWETHYFWQELKDYRFLHIRPAQASVLQTDWPPNTHRNNRNDASSLVIVLVNWTDQHLRYTRYGYCCCCCCCCCRRLSSNQWNHWN